MILNPPNDIDFYKPFQLFDPNNCETIINSAKKQTGERSRVQGNKEAPIRTSYTYWYTPPFPYELFLPFFEPFADKGYHATWISQPTQVARYEFGQKFDWHYDQFPGKRRAGRTLTMVATLQKAKDAFFETKDHSFDLDVGQAVIIPSNVLHRATAPVNGTRWSFTVWGCGKFTKQSKRK